MKKLFFSLFIAPFFSLGFSDFNAQPPPFALSPLPSIKEPELMIHNCPLAKINGQVISLYDVVKKMDLFLFTRASQDLPLIEQYHFYVSFWEKTLDEMINDELILLDAAQKEIKVNDAQVREELEARFGPQVLSNLHALNLEYEEARELIRQELTVQQLIGMKVHFKALQATTPEAIKKAYQEYLEKNPPEEQWNYQILSIRGKDREQCQSIAQTAYRLLKAEKASMETLFSQLPQQEGIKLHVSKEALGTVQKLSKTHLEILKELTPHSYSAPIEQVSRFDNQPVVRIFYLKEWTKKMPKPLDAMHDLLHHQLFSQTFEREKKGYIQFLKKRFGYQTHSPRFELSKDYQPFSIL